MALAPEPLPLPQPAKSASRPTDERGFTLVESMVAMVILTIGLVSLAELLAVSLRLQQLGRNETEAVRVAQDKMDQLMSLYFGDVGTGANEALAITLGGSLTADDTNHFDRFETGQTGYTRRWTVEAGPDGSANLRLVTIRVVPDLADRRTATPYELVSIIRRW